MDKLRTYKLIKKTFKFEEYLEILPDRKQRKSLAAFRISAHQLQIEHGRYSGKKIEERLCITCNDIEDEVHVFCDCIKNQPLRTKMNQSIGKTLCNSVSNREIFISFMTSTDENTLKSVGLFVRSCNIS